MQRRDLLATLALGALPAGPALAQATQNVARIVVTFAAGGPTDVVARMLAPHLGERLGLQVIVDNRPGAAGNIGVQEVARATPDGRTVVLVAPTVAVNPALYPNAPDPNRDLAAVTQLVSLQYVLVAGRGLQATDLRGFIARAKQGGKPISYASWGNGSHAHLCGALLAQMLGVEMLHVPYKGSAPAMQDVIAGQVDCMFDSVATAVPQVRAGTVRALAVSSTQPLEALPGIPPLASQVPGFDVTGWQGLMAPAHKPPAQLARWQENISAVLHDAGIRDRLAAVGLTPVGSTPAEFAAFVRRESEQYAALIRSNRIQAD